MNIKNATVVQNTFFSRNASKGNANANTKANTKSDLDMSEFEIINSDGNTDDSAEWSDVEENPQASLEQNNEQEAVSGEAASGEAAAEEELLNLTGKKCVLIMLWQTWDFLKGMFFVFTASLAAFIDLVSIIFACYKFPHWIDETSFMRTSIVAVGLYVNFKFLYWLICIIHKHGAIVGDYHEVVSETMSKLFIIKLDQAIRAEVELLDMTAVETQANAQANEEQDNAQPETEPETESESGSGSGSESDSE